jgi:hypothetical protein
MDTAISGLMNGIVDTGLPRFESVAGSPPDLFSTPQASYERERERERSRRAERVAYDRSVRRLRRHLFDNILHYCRAIWSAEDPQQRLMRYAAITVPTEWSLVGSYSAGGVLKGVWRPELTPTTSLADLVNPAGPIGFAGNYAVFYLKQDGRYPDLDDAVGYLRLPYLLHRVEVLEAGADLSASVEISPNRLGSGDYEVVFRSPGAGTSYCEVSQILGDAADGRSIYVRFARVDLGATGGDVSFHGLRLSLTRPGGVLRDGDSVVISVSVDASLEDPEVRMIRFGLQPLDPSIEADYYTSEVLGEYEEFFPAVARALSARDAGAAWADLDDSTRRLVRGYRAEYELRKRHTRRFLLETNNVLLSRAVDPATSLETFKSLHRYIDVLASATDFEAKRIENARRERRLVLDRLGDPDVDRVTVVTGGVSPDFPAIDPTDDT